MLLIDHVDRHRPLSRRLDRCDRVIQNESRDPFGGNVYYVTMQITFLTRKFRNGERDLHCDVVHITTKWVPSLTLDCNGVFAIKAYGRLALTVRSARSKIDKLAACCKFRSFEYRESCTDGFNTRMLIELLTWSWTYLDFRLYFSSKTGGRSEPGEGLGTVPVVLCSSMYAYSRPV